MTDRKQRPASGGAPEAGRFARSSDLRATAEEDQRQTESLSVALVSEVFWQPDGATRLTARLREAADAGADLALLPELPLNAWRPATREAVDEDAEQEGGPRTHVLAQAARAAAVAVLGGIIHRDPASGRRTSRALLLDHDGAIVARYEKLHLPEEPGFWETSHYSPGKSAPRPVDGFALALGIQICSDINRPEGSHLLGALGAEVILAPRATERRTYQRWKLVFQANALTSCTYVLSVNRPEPEAGVLIGGPSIAVDPNGRLLVETTDRLALVRLERSVIRQARVAYPGYLPVRASLYAKAWSELASMDGLPAD